MPSNQISIEVGTKGCAASSGARVPKVGITSDENRVSTRRRVLTFERNPFGASRVEVHQDAKDHVEMSFGGV